jgi:glycosyltransferase involved in cell wall biosynthesis
MVSWPGRTNWLDLTIQKLIEPKFEKLFYTKADSVVFVTKHMQQEAIKRCPLLLTCKTHVVRNGYDTDDFSEVNITHTALQNKFNITYTGTLRSYHNAEPFIRAPTTLLEKNFLSSNEIVVRIIGDIVSDQRSLFINLPSNIVEFVDTVSHKEAIKYQISADLLLLLLPEDSRGTGANVLAGKVFEYIGSGKPIFAFASEGELADLIRENQFGYVVDPGKPEEIEAALLTAYQNWKKGVNIVSSENSEQFTRESQCQALSHIIKEVANKHKAQADI